MLPLCRPHIMEGRKEQNEVRLCVSAAKHSLIKHTQNHLKRRRRGCVEYTRSNMYSRCADRKHPHAVPSGSCLKF